MPLSSRTNTQPQSNIPTAAADLALRRAYRMAPGARVLQHGRDRVLRGCLEMSDGDYAWLRDLAICRVGANGCGQTWDGTVAPVVGGVGWWGRIRG